MNLSLLAAEVSAAASSVSATELVQFALDAINLGVLGVVFWLFVRGHLHSDSEVGRLAAENNRLVTEKRQAEERRDEALQVAQEKLLPLLVNFVNVTGVLIPLLQQVVAAQERGRNGR